MKGRAVMTFGRIMYAAALLLIPLLLWLAAGCTTTKEVPSIPNPPIPYNHQGQTP